MNSEPTDSELLERFARQRDQGAFAQIVDRHAGLVYSAALRQVGPGLADDVSQAVFFILAQKAHQVDGRTLAGWLVKAARLTGMASRRVELRRKQREQKAALMKHESDDRAPAAPSWELLAPLLDAALARLGEKDRSAVTLRYLEGKSVREVAALMGVSEAAAGKRATRAVQALRDYFSRCGVNLTPESLASVLVAHGVVAVPAGLAAKLSATAGGAVSAGAVTAGAATGGAATAGGAATTLSASAAGIVKATLPLMLTTKTHVAVVAIASVLLLAGGAMVAGHLVSSRRAATPQLVVVPTPSAQLSDVNVTAETGADGATMLPEIFTRYPTPPGESASFTGRVEGLINPANAEVGLIYLRGTHWLTTNNYQWQAVRGDGTFTITADRHPEARRALAVRAKGQFVTYLRAEFEPNESARDVVVRMKRTRPVTITARNASGARIPWFKAEIFDAAVDGGEPRTDDQGRALLVQRLDAPVASRGTLDVDLPLEPISLFISGPGLAPYFHTIDPRVSDRYEFKLQSATRISGTVTHGGTPVEGVRVMLNNDAVPLSYVARKTDASGEFSLAQGIPGTYTIAVRGRQIQVPLLEGEPQHVKIDLATPEKPADDAGDADAVADPTVSHPSP